jgi:hypothetical protein
MRYRFFHCAAAVIVPLLLTATVQARDISCNIKSDYDLTINDRSVIFTRASGQPKWVVMRQGKLFVDDRWVQLGADDQRRVADFERGARAAMPLAQEIGRDAADIAFTALGEVAAGFSNNPDRSRASLDKAREEVDARLASAISANRFSSKDLGEGIGEAVTDVVPMLMGDIVGGAVSAAFSGDSERLKKMENLDKEIEARIEPRAKALEKRSERLCDALEELDRLDSALAYRLPGGGALNLLENKPDHGKPDQNDTSSR